MDMLVKELNNEKVTSPNDVVALLADLAEEQQEIFIVLHLNGANRATRRRIVTIGTLNASLVHPREVFANAVADRVNAIIVAHNHPSGEVVPSAADNKTTKALKEAGDILGIKVLDHIIFAKDAKYYSYQEDGTM